MRNNQNFFIYLTPYTIYISAVVKLLLIQNVDPESPAKTSLVAIVGAIHKLLLHVAVIYCK